MINVILIKPSDDEEEEAYRGGGVSILPTLRRRYAVGNDADGKPMTGVRRRLCRRWKAARRRRHLFIVA